MHCGDIALNFEGQFNIELIISDGPILLPPMPERLNSQVFVRDAWQPVLTVEAYQLPSPMLLEGRFPSRERWVEGVNLFVERDGRI